MASPVVVLLAACALAVVPAPHRDALLNVQCFRPRAGSCGDVTEACCEFGWDLLPGGYCLRDDGLCAGKTSVNAVNKCAEPRRCGLCGQGDADACNNLGYGPSFGHGIPALLDLAGKYPTLTIGKGVGRPPLPLPLSPTTPQAEYRLVLGTHEGMAGWWDTNAVLTGFRESLLGMEASVPAFAVIEGFRVQYLCMTAQPLSPDDWAGCNIFAFAYRCPGCAQRDGGFGAQLLARDNEDWYAHSCGPDFQLDPSGAKHPLVAYSAEVPPGDRNAYEVVFPANLQFGMFGAVGKAVLCYEHPSEADCGGFPVNCMWVDGTCRPRICGIPSSMGVFTGPSIPKCQTCLEDEQEFFPVLQTPAP